jgi:hypothetical protein
MERESHAHLPRGYTAMDTESRPIIIAGHTLRFDAAGQLMPWTSWIDALNREMNFYQECPTDRGYPRFAFTTFLDGAWAAVAERTDTIPATQNGMGILSYLKFHEFIGQDDPRYLKTACMLGDYLVEETLTPRSGRYPLFTRSTGRRDQFPQSPDAGSQADRPYEIEPDKGGIAGYALALLFEATGDARYFDQAVRNARALSANQAAGDAFRSPWPFRADLRNGEGRGPVSGNMSFILRLYDVLSRHGFDEFSESRESLWMWIKRYQIPSAASDGALFAQFFEDHDTPTNRTAWAPLNLARYLLEKKQSIDPDWDSHAAMLLEFVRTNFTHVEFGLTLCHEQDEDREAWGGVNSTYGAVLALFAKATGSVSLEAEARQALNFTLHLIDEQGRPRDLHKNPAPGGWQEDAHTDVIHNYVDVLRAFPYW